MTNETQNPFTQREELTELFFADTHYQKVSQEHKRKVMEHVTLHPESLIRMTQRKLSGFFASHTIAALLISLLVFTSISASAFQLLGPENLKPSTVFQNLFQPVENEQIDTDSTIQLSEDTSNDIVTSEACGVTLKYPKQLNNKALEAVSQYSQNFNFKESVVIQPVRSASANPYIETFSITCFDSSEDITELTFGDTPQQDITTDILAEFTGWFIAEKQLNNLSNFYNPETGLHHIVFSYNQNNYIVSGLEKVDANKDGLYDRQPEWPGLFVNQIQIQFADQVEEEPTTEIIQEDIFAEQLPPETEQIKSPKDSNIELPIGTLQNVLTVSHIDACNLYAGYTTSGNPENQIIPEFPLQSKTEPNISVVHFYTQAETNQDLNIPVLEIQCSDSEIPRIPKSQDVEYKPESRDLTGYLSPETANKAVVTDSYWVEISLGVTLDSPDFQEYRRIATHFTLDGLHYRIVESEFYAPTAGVTSVYPYTFAVRSKPGIVFQHTSVVDTSVPIADDYAPIPTSTKQIVTLKPALASQFIRTDTLDIINQCGVDGTVSYTTLPFSQFESPEFARMDIITPDRLSVEQLAITQRALTTRNTSLEAFGSGAAFSVACGGGYSDFISELEVNYPGTTKVRAYLASEGNGIGGDPVVRVIAEYDGQYIMLSKSLAQFDSPKYDQYVEARRDLCAVDYSTFRDCYNTSMQNDTILLNDAQQTVQELVQTFRIQFT